MSSIPLRAAVLAVLAVSIVVFAAENRDSGQSPVASSAAEAHPLGIGESVPAVTVQDSSGASHNLKEFISGKKTAIIFYRGGWCPFCNKHLSEIASIQDEIAKAGYQVIGINPDRPEDIVKSLEKKSYPFAILSDSDLAAARAFGLAFKLDDDTVSKYNGYGIKLVDSAGAPRYSLPVPAFYLVDEQGAITFSFHDADYTKRIAKDDVLKAIGAN